MSFFCIKFQGITQKCLRLESAPHFESKKSVASVRNTTSKRKLSMNLKENYDKVVTLLRDIRGLRGKSNEEKGVMATYAVKFLVSIKAASWRNSGLFSVVFKTKDGPSRNFPYSQIPHAFETELNAIFNWLSERKSLRENYNLNDCSILF